ncbi:hypothetical protein NM208_g5200 [Fusarium decemcellulare]|uniref:Uncharacterized protein n=1 Tax=Fusarium decemcellulare TaxID=57161 RepID=A0ACC1SHZ7_9HYPO|nr:hypothetical protein NM208_g5200 [Fusarium decemcellulare]
MAGTFNNDGDLNVGELLQGHSEMLRKYLVCVRNITWNRPFFTAFTWDLELRNAGDNSTKKKRLERKMRRLKMRGAPGGEEENVEHDQEDQNDMKHCRQGQTDEEQDDEEKFREGQDDAKQSDEDQNDEDQNDEDQIGGDEEDKGVRTA